MVKQIAKKITCGPMSPIASWAFDYISSREYRYYTKKWEEQGWEKPKQDEIDFVCKNVTVIFKSFERQNMAQQLYVNLQDYYPGIKVIIADDSLTPLELQGDSLEIIQLPFNSGLCYGLNCALARVTTPYVMRMDDDQLLTQKTCLGDQVSFLEKRPEIDLVSFCTLDAIRCKDPNEEISKFTSFNMQGAPKALRIPHMTQIDGNHFVMGKVPNSYVARTEKVRSVGWDDHIRMLDHQDFFWRAAGNLVSVIALGTVIFHYHNPFQKNYQRYRQNVEGDRRYIAQRRRLGQ